MKAKNVVMGAVLFLATAGTAFAGSYRCGIYSYDGMNSAVINDVDSASDAKDFYWQEVIVKGGLDSVISKHDVQCRSI
ncbi:MAG: hypothetical protein Q4B88_05020 [Moraxella sp.]|nr:hypothetical protein [Moraxella sp.]